MKNTTLLLAVVTATLALCSCQQPKTAKHVLADSTLGFIPIDTSVIKQHSQLVPADTGISWANAFNTYADELYRKNAKGEFIKVERDSLPRIFTFRTSDLLAALGLNNTSPNTNHIRAYLGIDALGQRKLFFVGVVGANLNGSSITPGTDVFFRPETNSVGDPGDPGDLVLDLNYPCPTLCPEIPLGQSLSRRAKK